MSESKSEEMRVRRMAKRIGWRVVKSRAKILHSNNHGKFMLLDDRNIVQDGDHFDATLNNIEILVAEEWARMQM